MSTPKTPKGRISFPHLFEKYQFQKNGKPSGKPKYSVVLVFDKAAQATPEFLAMKTAANEAVRNKWPDPKKRTGLLSPFHDADERATPGDDGKLIYADGYPQGSVFVNLKSDVRPGVVDARKITIEEPSKVYAGSYGRASISCYAYDNVQKGVNFGLINFQWLEDGDPIDGRPAPTDPDDDFDAFEGAGAGGAEAGKSSDDLF